MIIQEVKMYLQETLKEVPNVEKMVINPGFSGVLLNNGQMGIAMNVRGGTGFTNVEIQEFLAQQIGKNGLETAEKLMIKASQSEITKNVQVLLSILVALFNALSQPFMNEEYLCTLGYDVQVGGQRNPGQLVKKGEIVTIVGFGGMVRTIAQAAAKTYVTELEPELFKATLITSQGVRYGPTCAEVVPSAMADSRFEEADTVFVTGCTLVTNTMEKILEKCRGRKVIVYGSTAGFIPEPLFKRGVKVLTTRRVTNPDLMVDLLLNSAGAVERFFPQASEDILISKLSG